MPEYPDSIYRTLFDMADTILLVLDPDGRVGHLNQKGCEVLGLACDDIVGKDWYGHFLPEDCRLEAQRVFRDLVNGHGKTSVAQTTPLLTASGAQRVMSWRHAVLRDSADRVAGVLSSGLDITDLRLAQTAWSESEAGNRIILDTAVDGIVVVDEASRVVFANPGVCHLSGYSSEELQGHAITDLMPARYREQHQAAFLRYLNTGLPSMPWRNLSFSILHRDGREVPVEVRIGEQSRTGRRLFFGILRDVTESRDAELALRASQARYHSLFENMLDGYAYCRMLFEDGAPLDFIYLDVNPAFERLTGLKAVTGKRVSEVIPGIHAANPELFEIYGRVSMTGKPERFETFLPALDRHFSVTVYRPEKGHFVAIFENITERRQAQIALREQKERTQLLLDFMADGMYGVDTEGNCTFVNPAGLRLLGYERAEDLLGRHAHEIIHHSHADGSPYPAAHCRAYRAYVEDRGIHVEDEVFWRRDGSAIPVEYWSYPMRRAGKVIGSVVTFHDIGERLRTQAALFAANQTLQTVIDTVPHHVFWKDRQFRYLGCNRAHARMAGVDDPKDMVGRDDFDFAWRRFAHLYQRDDTLVMETETPKLNIIEPVDMGTGEVRWLEASKAPLRDAQGKVIGVLGMFQDITERHQSEEKLRQAAKVFESTTEGVMISDANGNIVAMNRAFTDITGYAEAEVIGRNTRLLKSERHDPSFYQAMWASILQTGSWRGEIWNRRKNGETYPEWLTINTVKDEAGAIVNYVGVFSDISQMKRSEAELDYMVHHDPLTELPNRLLLGARLEHAIQRAHREDTALVVLFIDLDRFKTVNDSLGHPAGDLLLQVVADLISNTVRGEDTVARLGGDEFVVLLEGLADTGFASDVADKILHALSRPVDLGGQSVFVGASIGISTYPADGQDGTTLLKNADAAMYRAKGEGRNTYRFYSAELTRSARERLTLETEMRRAIEQEEFVLHYQPQVDVASGRMVGVEALVRWHHPHSGLISPLRFIPLAEETGLILPLGDWVLHAACEQLQTWLASGLPAIALSVNLSPRQFQRRDLVGQIRAVLDATGLPPHLLELEITEGAIMEQGEQARSTLLALKSLGGRLAIDDFGTGYSSLAYLKRFPIDILKIDQSFMRDIPHDQSAMEIAATIIAMARNLHMHVLAEGVETEAQLEFLQVQGCDAYQGYHYSRPLPVEEFETLLRAKPVGK